MAGLIHELIENLNGLISVYNELTALCCEKKGYLIDNDAENIKRITALETTIVARVNRADKERVNIIKDVCQVLGRNESELTLTALGDLIASQPEHKEYVEVVERLKSAAADLNEINERNKVLITNAMELLDFSINAIRSTMDTNPAGFGRDGEEYRESTSFLDING